MLKLTELVSGLSDSDSNWSDFFYYLGLHMTQIKLMLDQIPSLNYFFWSSQSVLPVSHDFSLHSFLTAETDPVPKTTCAVLQVLVVSTR